MILRPTEAAEQAGDARLIAVAPTMYAYIAKRAASGDNEAMRLLEIVNERC